MKRIPEFRNEDDERKFWATADPMEYVNWAAGRRRKLIHLKPTLKTLMKVFLGERRARRPNAELPLVVHALAQRPFFIHRCDSPTGP